MAHVARRTLQVGREAAGRSLSADTVAGVNARASAFRSIAGGACAFSIITT